MSGDQPRRLRSGVRRPAHGGAIALLAATGLLEVHGPTLGRPHVDTLKGSRYANMKDLRFDAAGGVWRVAFAFDPKRQAVILVAGDKADKRFGEHLESD